jgi:hypothetical protein
VRGVFGGSGVVPMMPKEASLSLLLFFRLAQKTQSKRPITTAAITILDTTTPAIWALLSAGMACAASAADCVVGAVLEAATEEVVMVEGVWVVCGVSVVWVCEVCWVVCEGVECEWLVVVGFLLLVAASGLGNRMVEGVAIVAEMVPWVFGCAPGMPRQIWYNPSYTLVGSPGQYEIAQRKAPSPTVKPLSLSLRH